MPATTPQTAEFASVSAAPPPRKSSWLRWTVRLGVAAIAVTLLYEGYRIVIGINSHVVLPGKVYRSAQPNPDDIRAAVKEYGLRTVFSLRGRNTGQDFCDDEVAACKELGLQYSEFEFSATRLPSDTELKRFVLALEAAEQPVLLHCKRGSDRTGLTSVIAAVLIGDVPYDIAKSQLSLRFAHLTFGPTRQMSAFFRFYECWLAKTGQTHSRERFRHWLMVEYRGGNMQYVREAVVPLQPENKVGVPLGFRVRYLNTSDVAWHFNSHRSAGIHGVWAIGNWRYEPTKTVFGRSGHFERTVEPGQTIEVTYVLPAFAKAGSYPIYLDLVEERHAHFAQVGADPFEEELVVHE